MKMRSLVLSLLIIFLADNKATAQINISVNEKNGDYIISSAEKIFKGSIGHQVTSTIKKQGVDINGPYKEISFAWKDSIAYVADIKSYDRSNMILFSLKLPDGAPSAPVSFPSFTEFPLYNYKFSYYDDNFAPAQFKLNETSTPWMFFDDSLHTFVISPASDFMVAKMSGDGKRKISSGLNSEIKNLPKDFTHTTILMIGKGIQHTWDDWGNALRKMYNRYRSPNDGDKVLKYFGYWTDNGADYYYNYDLNKGYASTLVDLVNKYKGEKIPLGYLQLDSWWYDKSIYDVNGKPVADHKNPKLPYGMWNRYGGLMSYTADSFLFPKGLQSFQQQIGLPLVTHNRWVDPHSPYHDKYTIIGFAATDPAYWDHILQPIAQAGVVCYEQDWLNYIYSRTPQMASDINVGNAFTDAMAKSAQKARITMQYCMAMPRYFLQGLKYNNLTTIRTSGDRFNPENWKSFLYTSQLGYEIGAWPWCDVFKSGEKGNMILAVLSAGVVGTGDAIGKENKENILKACRTDAVLVKPDAPLFPLDNDYLNDATNSDAPFLAYTYTKHNSITTGYLFAFNSSKDKNKHIDFTPAMLGMKNNVVVLDPETQAVTKLNTNDHFSDSLSDELYKYYIIAPVTTSGIAFLGDMGKIAATGKKRIAYMNSIKDTLLVTVAFANDEQNVILHGYSEKPVTSDKGTVQYDAVLHLFTIDLKSEGRQNIVINVKQVNSTN